MKPLGRAVAWSAMASLLVLGGIAGCQGRGALGGTPYYGPGSAPVPAPSSLKNSNHPKRLYVANSGSNDIFIATFDTSGSGAIFPINTNNIPTGSVPLAIAGHPSIPFMVVCNQQSGDIWTYTMDIPTGNLRRFGSPVSIGSSPVAMKWSPNGKYLYVLENAAKGPALQTFNFDQTTQTLTASNNQTTIGQVAGGSVNPQTGQQGGGGTPGTATALAIAGTKAFVATATPDQVAVLNLASDGSSSQLGKLANGGPTQTSIGVYPPGQPLWITNAGSGDLNLYTLDSSNNLQQNPTPIKAGQFPMDIVIDQLGKYAYVVNVQSGDVNMYQITGVQGSTATLTPNGAVGALAQQMTGTQPWQGQGLPDNVVAAGGVQPAAMVIDDAVKYAYVLNLGVSGQQTIPPFLTIMQIMDGTSNPVGQVPPPSSPPSAGTLYPVMLPTQAVPNGQNPVVCGGAPGSVFPQPDDITIY